MILYLLAAPFAMLLQAADWVIVNFGPFLSAAGLGVAVVTGLLAFASQVSAGIATPALLGSRRWYGRASGWFVLGAGVAFSAVLVVITLVLAVASALATQGLSSYTSPFGL